MPDFGKVEGQYLTIVVDGDDQDLVPDILPLKGTVTFLLTTPEFAEAGGQPNPKSYGTSPIISTLDAEGYLTTPAFGGGSTTQRGIWLIATDSSGINPTELLYEVSFDLKAPDNRPIPFKTQYISVPKTAGANNPVWLNAVSEQPEAPPISSAAATALLALALEAAEGALRGIGAGQNISIDTTDPLRPIISASGGGGGGTGTVSSVNGKSPNGVGEVTLAFSDLGGIQPSDVGLTANTKVLVRDAVGAFNMISYSQTAEPNAMARFDGSGRLRVVDANAATQAASKGQMDTALALKADASAVTTSLSSKADLVAGLIPQAQLPPIAITEFLGSPSTQAAMLALTGQKGDWAIRLDRSTVWVITGEDPTQVSNWQEFSYPISPVISVANRTGAITLSKSDVGLNNVDNTSDANKPVSNATVTALGLKADDSAVVKLTGNQSVAGVKDFTNSPTVPTPTTATQAANKAYVDSAAAAAAALVPRTITASSTTAPEVTGAPIGSVILVA